MRARGLAIGLIVFSGVNAPVAIAQSLPVATGERERADDDPLAQVAVCLERGDTPAAAGHLDAYVRRHPDQLMYRAHLAELLLKSGRVADAQYQFERFIANAQDSTGPPRLHLVHCHTRLMEIGRQSGNRFTEVFHRGVGLLVLLRQQGSRKMDASEPGEEIACRALKALVEAREHRPTDPRIHFYLAEAYDRVGNRRAADVARATARNLATEGTLTPSERRHLSIAAR